MTRSISNPHKFKPDYSTMNSEKEFKEMNKVIDANQTMKTKKVQGFLPRELLLFLGLDH